VLGKHSGRHALVARYEELGFQLKSDQVVEIYSRFVALADKKKNIYDQDLLAMVPEITAAVLAA
jgi:2-isopropylmalate synthase